MKVIINGKKYDTDTAKRVCGYSWGYCSDFHYISETLYRKKTGEFFICGKGGAMSKYSQSYGDGSFGGAEEIIPITVDDAKKFTEEYVSVEAYYNIFCEVEE